MEKFKIAHYQKSGSMWFTNGGKLIITENEYIVKYLFQTVTNYINNEQYSFLESKCKSLRAILVASINTARESK